MDASPQFRPLRIFLAENHVDTLKYLTLYLQQLGHSVTSASSMTGALHALSIFPYDVLISDIGLPDGDGWQLLERSKLAGSVYAIAMSGFGMNADRAKSRTFGFRHHLLKPFDPVALDAMLEEASVERAATDRAQQR